VALLLMPFSNSREHGRCHLWSLPRQDVGGGKTQPNDSAVFNYHASLRKIHEKI
jgi:hypothetical protein